MARIDEEPKPPTSLEEHLTKAIDQTDDHTVSYHVREALQMVYGESAEQDRT